MGAGVNVGPRLADSANEKKAPAKLPEAGAFSVGIKLLSGSALWR